MSSEKLLAPALLMLMAIITAQKIEPMCLGPGVWPHPHDCRLFSLCQLNATSPNRIMTAQVFLCPSGLGFSATYSTCIPSNLVSKCSQNTKISDKLLDASPILHLLQSTHTSELSCAGHTAPYCDATDILVVCGPNQVSLGTVNCSTVISMNSGMGLCDKKTNSCVKNINNVNNAMFHEFSMTRSEINLKNITMVTTSSPNIGNDDSIKQEEKQNNEEQRSKSEPITELQIQLTDTSTVMAETTLSNNKLIDMPEYSSENAVKHFSNQDTEDNTCKREGLQCANNATIIDCPDDLGEPLFQMSCSDMIQMSNADEATGYCSSDISSCILEVNEEDVILKLSLFDIGDYNVFPDFLSKCSQGGLHCADNNTLVLCSGFSDTIDYAITCGSQDTLLDGDLNSYCDAQTESCIISTNDISTSFEDNSLTQGNTLHTSLTKKYASLFGKDNNNYDKSMLKLNQNDFKKSHASNLQTNYKENVGTLENIPGIPRLSTTIMPLDKNAKRLEVSVSDMTGKLLGTYLGANPNVVTICSYPGWQCLNNDILVFCSQHKNIYGFLSCSEAYKDSGNNIYCDNITSKCIIEKEVDTQSPCQKPGLQCLNNKELGLCSEMLSLVYSIQCQSVHPQDPQSYCNSDIVACISPLKHIESRPKA